MAGIGYINHGDQIIKLQHLYQPEQELQHAANEHLRDNVQQKHAIYRLLLRLAQSFDRLVLLLTQLRW